MSRALADDPDLHSAIHSCVTALRRVAEYRLDPGLDQRMLELGERKEFLSQGEHQELQGLVAFTQQPTIEKLEAKAALTRLEDLFPDVVSMP